jgi:hypothetical protein
MRKDLFQYLILVLLFTLSSLSNAQDIVHMKNGSSVACKITQISDFILYAEVDNDPYPATFFADDVSHLDIHAQNTTIIRELRKGVKEAMKFSNPLEDNQLYGFYFGIPYDSIDIYTNTNFYELDSLGNPILVPYNPLEKSFSERLKSLGKSLSGSSLTWLIGGL